MPIHQMSHLELDYLLYSLPENVIIQFPQGAILGLI